MSVTAKMVVLVKFFADMDKYRSGALVSQNLAGLDVRGVCTLNQANEGNILSVDIVHKESSHFSHCRPDKASYKQAYQNKKLYKLTLYCLIVFKPLEL